MRADFLTELDERDQEVVLAAMGHRRWAKGETLFRQGEPGDSLSLIERGRVAMQFVTPSGQNITTAVFGPGRSIGHIALLSGRAPRTLSAVAIQPTETAVLTRAGFNDLRRRYPRLEEVVLELMGEHITALALQLTQTMYAPVDQRLLKRLVAMAPAYSVDDGPTTVTLTQEELAVMVGTTRPTVNQILRAVEKDGLIRLGRGRIVLVDLAEIERRAE
jgi:CRP/FNR family cyclic AMP-dependent transcriptional regulator